jgi:acetylornithine deacetylase
VFVDSVHGNAPVSVDRKTLVDLLRRMIQLRSYSGEEVAISCFLADFMRNLGLEVRTQEVEKGRQNVIGVLHGTGGGNSLLYNGHVDTNPVGLGWTVDPFSGEVRNDCIYGIGVSNMKASDAAFLMAVQSLVQADATLRGDVIIALVVGELQGGIGTVRMLSEGIRADWFVNGEPTDLSLLTMHAGTLEIQIDVEGVSRHMSRSEDGINAIEQTMRVVAGLKKLKRSSDNDPYGLYRINIGAIRGGLGTEYLDWRIPQLPDLCTLKVALRYPPTQTRDAVVAQIQTMLNDIANEDPSLRASIELSPKMPMPPFEVHHDEVIVRSVQRSHCAVTGVNPRIGPIAPYKFYGTDAGHLAAAGMKGVVYGCGGKYNTMPDERVALTDLYTASEVYRKTIVDICDD